MGLLTIYREDVSNFEFFYHFFQNRENLISLKFDSGLIFDDDSFLYIIINFISSIFFPIPFAAMTFH